MKYLGGKHNIGKEIAAFMVKKCEGKCDPVDVKGYLEPFCGSLGVFKQMTDKGYKKYIASDIQPDLIEMWKELQDDKLKFPKEINEKKWFKLRDSKKPSALRAVAGFGMSFGGEFFQGYAQKYAGTSGRDFYGEVKRSLNKIKPKIDYSNVKFYNKSYKKWNPTNMLIYCDPPYKDTVGYSATEGFNHDEFWDTMREWSKNNYVFISEEAAPKDFKCVWKRQKRRTLNKKVRDYKVEKLYMYRNGLTV
jgi:site-specific DNA-adenine methylase